MVAGIDVGKANLDVSVSEGTVIRFENTLEASPSCSKISPTRMPIGRCANPPAVTNGCCWTACCQGRGDFGPLGGAKVSLSQNREVVWEITVVGCG